jgi:flagellar biosynthesis chaperone FliJ
VGAEWNTSSRGISFTFYNNKGYENRKLRRKAVKSIVSQLEDIRDAEDEYKENMPNNLKSSSRFSNAEKAIEMLDEAIEQLNESFA